MKLIRIIIGVCLLVLAMAACDSEGDKFDYQKVGLLISGTEQVPVQRFTVDELPASYADQRGDGSSGGYL